MGLPLLSALAAIFRIIVKDPALVFVWALFSLIMALGQAFAKFVIAHGSQAHYEAMDKWDPLTDVSGADLPLIGRVVVPLLLVVSIAFYQATLNRAVMPSPDGDAGFAQACVRELKRFGSIVLLYAILAGVGLATGPLLDLGWTAAHARGMAGFDPTICFFLNCFLLTKLSLVSPAAYDTGRMGFAESWRLTNRHGRLIFLMLLVCALAAVVMELIVVSGVHQSDMVTGGKDTPTRSDVSSVGAFLQSSGLRWNLLRSALNALFWPIILAPLPAVYVKLSGRPESAPGKAPTPARRGFAIAMLATVVAVVLVLGFFGLSFMGQVGGKMHFAQTLSCSDLGRKAAAAQAIAKCDALLQSPDMVGPSRGQVLRYRGEDYRDEGDNARALTDLTEADRLDPKEFHTLQDLGDVHEAVGDYATAAGDYKRLFVAAPDMIYPMMDRCSDEAHDGKDLAKARTDCEAVVGVRPREPQSLDGAAVVALKQSRFQDAWADFDAAARVEPNDARHLYGRGLAAIDLGRAADGHADLAAAAKIDPRIAGTFSGWGLKPSS